MNDTEQRKSIAQSISDFLIHEAQCGQGGLENPEALGENIYDLIIAPPRRRRSPCGS